MKIRPNGKRHVGNLYQRRDVSPCGEESEDDPDDNEEFTSYKCVATSSSHPPQQIPDSGVASPPSPSGGGGGVECRKRELEGDDVEVVKRNKPSSASLAAIAAAANYRQQNCLSIIQVINPSCLIFSITLVFLY